MRKPLVTLSILAFGILGCSGLCWFCGARFGEYSRFEYYSDTGLVPIERGKYWHYGEIKGHLTLLLRHGQPSSLFASSRGWDERLSLELPGAIVGKFLLEEGKVKVGFASNWGRTHWTIGEKGVSGHLDIKSVQNDRITASYFMSIDTIDQLEHFLPEHQHRQVAFEGQATFYKQSISTNSEPATYGNLFP